MAVSAPMADPLTARNQAGFSRQQFDPAQSLPVIRIGLRL